MNKSVLRTTLVVIVCMLVFEYILKFFVPEEFVLVVSNPNIIKFGTFLNTHKVFYHIFFCITAFITYFLFTCACSRKKYLDLKLSLVILAIVVLSAIITVFAYQYATPFLICSMVLLALLSNSNMRDFAVVFIVHTVAQNLSLNIRNLSTYIVSFDVLTCILLGIESYLWLLLFYFLNCFNIKEKESEVR